MMNKSISEILDHIRLISGNNLIAGSVNYFLKNGDFTTNSILNMANQLKDQINDNPEMMQKLLSTDNYNFFSNWTLINNTE
ncbi:MAG: hypothetical protein H7068_07900 [Pedobacter sp.]|nr:hypothetical protein [Chitinophagaceae bacterium]